MVRIDCKCMDVHTKIYLKNLLVSDLARATADKDTAIKLSPPKAISKIEESYGLILKNFRDIFEQIERIDICK